MALTGYSLRVLKNFTAAAFLPGGRTLYTLDALRVNGFLRFQESFYLRLGPSAESFKQRMYERAKGNEALLAEDMKKVMLLAKTPEDLNIVKLACQKFVKTETGHFDLAAVLMRLCHAYKFVPQAVDMLKSPELNKAIVNNLAATLTLMNLLVSANENKQAIELYHSFIESDLHKKFNSKYPGPITDLYVEACFKENTPEALDLLVKLYQKIKAEPNTPNYMIRTHAKAILTAINQKKPEVTTDMMTFMLRDSPVSLNIKAMVYAQLGRLEEALFYVESIINNRRPTGPGPGFGPMPRVYSQTMRILREVVEKQPQNSPLRQSFETLSKKLFDGNYMGNVELDEILSRETGLRSRSPGPPQRNTGYSNNSMMRNRSQSRNNFDRFDRNDRGDRFNRNERGDRFDRGDRNERPDRFDRGDRSERPDRGDRGDRPERGDRPDRPDRPDRGERRRDFDGAPRFENRRRDDFGGNQRPPRPGFAPRTGGQPSGGNPRTPPPPRDSSP